LAFEYGMQMRRREIVEKWEECLEQVGYMRIDGTDTPRVS